MRAFTTSIEIIILRYYLLMAVVILPWFLGLKYLSLLALPVFLSALMGISFRSSKNKSAKAIELKIPKTEHKIEKVA